MLLEDKIVELVAIGASVSANCQPCVEYHVAKAKENGACKESIADAIEIGKMVRRGAAGKMNKFLSGVVGKGPSEEAGDDECQFS